MATEVERKGIIHGARVSLWDSRAHVLCGKTFAAGTYREKFFYGSVTCDDCKKAKQDGKKL